MYRTTSIYGMQYGETAPQLYINKGRKEGHRGGVCPPHLSAHHPDIPTDPAARRLRGSPLLLMTQLARHQLAIEGGEGDKVSRGG